jgi:hypothetical protein
MIFRKLKPSTRTNGDLTVLPSPILTGLTRHNFLSRQEKSSTLLRYEGREGKGREGKGREGKGREGKGREVKGRKVASQN